MDRADVEKIRLRIIERRNYLKDVDNQITPSKRQLREGMRGRVKRKADSRFTHRVGLQKRFYKRKLSDVDAYLKELDGQSIAPLSILGGIQEEPQPLPTFTFRKMTPRPVKAKMRHFPRGIKGRMKAKSY